MRSSHNHLLSRILDDFIREGGQNPQQLVTLLAIQRHGCPKASEIRSQGFSINRFRNHLLRLEELGFVLRKELPGVWNWPRWTLTPKSSDMLDRFFK